MRYLAGTPIRLKVPFGPNAPSGAKGKIYTDKKDDSDFVMVAVGEALLLAKVSEIEILNPQQPDATQQIDPQLLKSYEHDGIGDA